MSVAAVFAVIFSGTVAIILVSGLVRMGNKHMERRHSAAVAPDEDVLERLALIERRLTDTQDVMLALSEKLDRWEEAVPPGARAIDEQHV